LTFIGLGLLIAALMTIRSLKKGEHHPHH